MYYYILVFMLELFDHLEALAFASEMNIYILIITFNITNYNIDTACKREANTNILKIHN